MEDTTSTARIERIVSPQLTAEESPAHGMDSRLRPRNFDEFPGQTRAKDNLKVYVKSAKIRASALDHVLLHGPPGLGKTSLARIIAQELGVSFFQTSGPTIDKPGDLAGLLAGLEPSSVLFIDEIHRLSVVVEEILYSAMEDFYIDIIVGQGPTARTIKMPVNEFTLIGATTRVSMLSSPLISRFGIQERFEFYDEDALMQIIERSAKIENTKLSGDGCRELARRSRGTPRIANRLLRRVRDFAEVEFESEISESRVKSGLNAMEIDARGLEPLDRKILATIIERYQGGPVGIEALSYAVGEDKATIEDVYEPFLVHHGLILRGSRGREITQAGIDHMRDFGMQVEIGRENRIFE